MRRSSSCSALARRVLARLASDCGSASIEFLSVGVLLLVPMVYLILTLSQVQTAVLGLEGGSRHAARVIAASDTHSEGMAAADRALRVAFADAGIDPDTVQITISCAPRPGDCTTRRGTVTVETAANVPLPLAPGIFGLNKGLALPVSARAVQPVSAYRTQP